MRTKGKRSEKINVVTLGCSKNIFDSEILMAQLRAYEFNVEHETESEDFDTVISQDDLTERKHELKLRP